MDKKARRSAYNKEYHRKNREKILQRFSVYQKTEAFHKINVIASWKRQDIVCDGEWDEVWEWWSSTKQCDICDVSLEGKKKCLDHDHHLKDEYNVRGILCSKCNNIRNELR